MNQYLRINIDHGVATLTLDRPQSRNALNGPMIARFQDYLRAWNNDSSIRVLVLTANGSDFCAGIDLKCLRQPSDRHSVALQLATLLQTLYRFNKPVIAVIEGGVYGGGNGLIACADIILAGPKARFCFSEVRLGLVPSVIGPYIVNAIGVRAARRYLLTAEVIPAQQALALGLVHQLVDEPRIDQVLARLCANLQLAAPDAIALTKHLINDYTAVAPDSKLATQTADDLSKISASAEAEEGIRAFFEKRPPIWLHRNPDTS